MDSIIRKHASGDSLIHYRDFEKLTGTYGKWYDFSKLYFFFDSELELKETQDPVVYAQMKNDSIRHLIPYKGRYFDYVANKEYKTLREWAEDNGKSLSNIRYGKHKFYLRGSWDKVESAHISLDQLLKFLDPKYNGEPVVEVSDKEKLLAQFDFLVEKMNELREKIEKMK